MDEFLSYPFFEFASKSLAARHLKSLGIDPTPHDPEFTKYNVDPAQAISQPSSDGFTTDQELDTYFAWSDTHPFTAVARAFSGFIIPNTRTYAVVGRNGGLDRGCSYKPHGKSGPATNTLDDYYNYYWFYDLKDILEADEVSNVLPYDHGKLSFLEKYRTVDGKKMIINNAHFDTLSGKLFVHMPGMGGSWAQQGYFAVFNFGEWDQ